MSNRLREEKGFGLVLGVWAVGLVLSLAFWGAVVYVVYRILVHFGIL